MTETEDIIIEADGTIRFVYSDALAEVFSDESLHTMRASHVEPAPTGGWLADMSPVGGPVLFHHDDVGFATRAEALAAERTYIAQHLGL